MNIHDALKSINWQKAAYFKYKFPELRYDQSRPLKSEEDFLRHVGRKTINPFTQWEQTATYKNLIQMYLETKLADDMEEIYQVVSDNAKKGDEKAIRLFLTIQKEVQTNAKLASKTFKTEEKEEYEYEDNELDLD